MPEEKNQIMNSHYTIEKNHQILIALLKAHGIRKVVASPGGTNISFVASIQNDPYFEIFSCIDERSAAYIACGIASQSGEKVALSCTGATSSRNYYPGLTEAYYRKLPILAITSSRANEDIGHDIPQVTDRRCPPKDVVKMSVYLPSIHSKTDEWSCQVNANKAILELTHNCSGPVHINLVTEYVADLSEKDLPTVRVVDRITFTGEFPEIKSKNIAIFIGQHEPFKDSLTAAIEEFCEKYNAVVLVDHTSNYNGKYKVYPFVVSNQVENSFQCNNIDLMIQLGNISGAYYKINPQNVWRINLDGELKDPFHKLQYVFEMSDENFFARYNNIKDRKDGVTFYSDWFNTYHELEGKLSSIMDILPFSNIWISHQLASKIPSNSNLYLGILNTLRSWNIFPGNDIDLCISNVGGFGIDGGISTAVGISLSNQSKLTFCILGDLSFFYDMNAMGNRHIGKNMRILVVNNGLGTEFKIGNSLAMRAGLGDSTDQYIAAKGHFISPDDSVIKKYVESIGFDYISAANKKEFNEKVAIFTQAESLEKPIVFEVFTKDSDENDALNQVTHLSSSLKGSIKSNAKTVIKGLIGQHGYESLRQTIKK
ncbi:thiamine pyrophosphate-binding protein [Moryella indoligenes]|nr:thiamine pyrophosphate-binding protein [Moryella indoligenes]